MLCTVLLWVESKGKTVMAHDAQLSELGKHPFQKVTKVYNVKPTIHGYFPGRERGQMLDLLIHVASSVTEYQTNSQGHLGRDRPLRTIVPTTQG